jgi:hypothetical protein
VEFRVTPGFVGVTAIDVKVANRVIVVEAVTAALPVPLVAVITAVCPVNSEEEDAGVTKPVLAPTVATAVLLLLQVTEVVRSRVELSEYVPVAVSCCTAVTFIFGACGDTRIDFSVAGVELMSP